MMFTGSVLSLPFWFWVSSAFWSVLLLFFRLGSVLRNFSCWFFHRAFCALVFNYASDWTSPNIRVWTC